MAPRQMTPRERFEQKKRHLEAELSNVEVIDHLNPSCLNFNRKDK